MQTNVRIEKRPEESARDYMVHALAKHHYEDSIEAMETGFDLYEPILTLCQQQYPQYFENPKGVEDI